MTIRSRALTSLLIATGLAVLAPTGPRAARSETSANCDGTSTGRIPLTDLGAGLYQGYQGGLYPGGSNARPAEHDSAGLAIARDIAPLDTLGLPDPSQGRIVFISIGMSNATQEFQTFIPKANADPERNPRVLIVDCAVGGQAANVIRNPNAAYWDSVTARLRRAGSAPAQVQCVWIKEANAGPTQGFPAAAESLQGNLASIVRILKQKLPNVKLTYLTSRIYAGYASTTLNPEPYAYESGFSVQWLIRSQIEGVDSLNYDPSRGAVVAPWIAWGPYLWADGLIPRSDGLTWPCSYFAADGTHPAAGARNLVSDSLLAFLKQDETARVWFTGAVTGAPSGSPDRARGPSIEAFPSPASRTLTVRRVANAPGGRLALVGVSGRIVRSVRWDGSSSDRSVTLDVSDLPSGVYYVVLRPVAGAAAIRKVVIAR